MAKRGKVKRDAKIAKLLEKFKHNYHVMEEMVDYVTVKNNLHITLANYTYGSYDPPDLVGPIK